MILGSDRRESLRTRAWLGSRVPLTSLVHTLAVAEYLNFRHAANALGTSQSSVSARIKALEEDLGVPLFERHTRGVRLTEAGRHFVERVSIGIDQLDHAIRTAGMVARGKRGTLRIGIHALIPGSFLANLLENYRDQHPEIEIGLVEGTARDSLMEVRANRLDVTFVVGSPKFPDCHGRQIWNERLFVVLPSRHLLAEREGVTWDELADDTFLVRHGGTGPQAYDHVVLRMAGRGANLSIQRFDVERATLLSMIAQGYGITIVGEATTQMYAPGVKFLPILDETDPITFSAVWSPHNRSAALRNLLDLAGKMIRAIEAS